MVRCPSACAQMAATNATRRPSPAAVDSPRPTCSSEHMLWSSVVRELTSSKASGAHSTLNDSALVRLRSVVR